MSAHGDRSRANREGLKAGTVLRSDQFLSGVIEAFYGRPWSDEQRMALFPRLRRWGMNTYMYAPKDDVKLRRRWRESYTAAEAAQMRALIASARESGLNFVYAISPGLDIHYSDAGDLERLIAKVDQVLQLGAQDVALLFDDIPTTLHPGDERQFGTIARAQAHVTNALFSHVRDRFPDGRRMMCPTDYCGRMAAAHDWAYLRELGACLDRDTDVFWTGDDVVTERMAAASLATVSHTMQRQPIVWDNLHANDYDMRRAYLGPYDGRESDLVGASRGILTNPNRQLELNDVAFATLSSYLRTPAAYGPDTALDEALADWRPRFDLDDGEVMAPQELRLLAELMYLPWRSGPTVEAILEDARALLVGPVAPRDLRIDRVANFALDVERLSERLTRLRDRALLHALHAFVRQAKVESQLLAEFVRHRTRHGVPAPRFGRPRQVRNTYRLGFAASVHALLPIDEQGAVVQPEIDGTMVGS